MTRRTSLLALALALGAQAFPSSGQACSVREFTFRDVEKIGFSDVIRHAGFSLSRPDKTELKRKDFEGSAAIYGVPETLQFDEARALSDFMLRSSGFTFSDDVRASLVRTALAKTGAEMYRDCAAVKNIQIAVPDGAYTDRNFDLSVTWAATAQAPDSVEYEITALGGKVQGKGGVVGTMKKGVAKVFDIDRTGNSLLKIDITVHGQAYPPITLPSPNREMAKFKIEKRAGTSLKPLSAPGNECGEQAQLISEEGTPAKSNSKSCRLCVGQSPEGFLLPSSAKADGQFSGTGKVALELTKPSQMCALFSVEGRGKKGGRQEVQNGVFFVWEMVPVQ